MSFIFDANEDPKQREARRQRQMSQYEMGMTQAPQNVGQGMSAVAQALNYRRLKGQQPQAPVGGPVAPGADPWSAMRQTARPNPFARVLSIFR